jgi:hypothetical protein
VPPYLLAATVVVAVAVVVTVAVIVAGLVAAEVGGVEVAVVVVVTVEVAPVMVGAGLVVDDVLLQAVMMVAMTSKITRGMNNFFNFSSSEYIWHIYIISHLFDTNVPH